MDSTTQMAPAAHGGAERLHALDAVRGGALLLGVVFHATMSFLPGQQVWMVRDEQSPALGVLFFVSHIFRMSLFFLLAGFFGRMSFHRRGFGGFVRDRLKRIGVPLVAFWPVLFPLIVVIFVWGVAWQYGLEATKEIPAPEGSVVETFPLTHLWFLYVLLGLYAAALAGRGLVVTIDRGHGLRSGIDKVLRALVRSGLAPFVLAAPTCLALYAKEDWRGLVGYVQQHSQRNDVIFTRTLEGTLPFNYYYRGQLKRVAMAVNNVISPLDDVTQEYDRIWLVYPYPHDSTHFVAKPAPLDLYGESEPTIGSWLVTHRRDIVEERDFSGLRLILYDP